MSEMREAMQDVKRALGKLGQHMPEEMKCFSQFMETVLKPGKLDLKTKELIALGTAITARCRYCIGIHTQKALAAGARRGDLGGSNGLHNDGWRTSPHLRGRAT